MGGGPRADPAGRLTVGPRGLPLDRGKLQVGRPGFGAGFASIFRGFGFVLATPKAWPFAAVPALVFATLALLTGWMAVALLRPWAANLVSDPSAWYAVAISWIATAVAIAVGLLLAMVLAPPLSGPALEKIVEFQEQRLDAPPRTPTSFVHEMWCGIRAMAFAAIFATPILVLLWIADLLIPGAAVVTLPLKFIVTSLGLAWNLFDYPLTLRDVRMRDRFRFVTRNWRATFGFGAAFALTFWVPCFGVILLPVGVAAATRMIWMIIEADPDSLPSLAPPAASDAIETVQPTAIPS